MIEAHIDHSALLEPVRNQGMRPTCLVFATSDLNAVANSTRSLSVEYLCHYAAKLTSDWQPGQGFVADAVLQSVETYGQPWEDLYPYLESVHDAPLREPKSSLQPLFSSNIAMRDLTLDDVVRHVHTAGIVGIVVAVTKSLFYPANGVMAFDPLIIPEQYHALLVVGLGTHILTGERYFKVRNSWGQGWGNFGYAWMPELHLTLHLIEGFLV